MSQLVHPDYSFIIIIINIIYYYIFIFMIYDNIREKQP